MGKFDGVLLASDFDNTLIYTEEALRTSQPIPPLGEENRRALEYFMAEGGKFALATGRALPSLKHLIPLVPFNAPCVVCNGAAIYDFEAEKYLEYAMLEQQALRRADVALQQFPTVGVEAYHIQNTVHVVHPNAATRQHKHLTHVDMEECSSMLEVPLPLGKLLFEEEHDVLEQVLAFYRQKGWAQDYEMIFSGKMLLEQTRKGATKGGMVLKLAQLLGVDRKDLYCVGDEANDLSMLREAAQGFAPENAIPAVRECGATIVSHARKTALADVIDILDEKYPG